MVKWSTVVKQPTLALGGHRRGTQPSLHTLARLCVQPKSRMGLVLATPLWPHTRFCLYPLAAPRNPRVGLEPLTPLAWGAGNGHVHEAAVYGGPAAGSWWGTRGLMDLMPMAGADTPALAQRETGAAQALRPCGVRGGSVGEIGSVRARCLGAASAQQHTMAQASCLYPTAASPPVPARNPASHPGGGSHSPLSISTVFLRS